MTLSWRYAVASDVGLLRDGNEDSAFAGHRLLAVADGMGGHAAGEVASAAAIAALEQLDAAGVDAGDPREALREAMDEANDTLREMVYADNDLEGMGTTVTAVLTDGDYTWLAHVGDSRAYLFREGALRQVTRDHTFVQQLVDEGRLAPEEVASHPQRNLITRVLDGREGLELDLDRLDVQPGDRLLLCSDGLTGVVSDDTIADALRAPTPDDAVRHLLDLALRAGAPDNVTCIVADLVAADGDGSSVVAGAAEEAPARPAPTTDETDHDDPRHKARLIRRRRAALTGIVVFVLVAFAGTAGYAWTQDQYYVGTSGDQVAIYRGVEGTLAGIDLSHVTERADLLVGDLPDFERKRVRDGIHASSLAEARTIVARLQAAIHP